MEALDFIARFGFVSRMSLMKRWGEERRQLIERLGWLDSKGLVAISDGDWDGNALHSCTVAGLRVCGRSALAPPPRARAEPLAIVAEMAAIEERLGGRVVSGRELAATEAGGLCESAASERLLHPDLVILGAGSAPLAVEVEVAPRGAKQLEELMRTWAAAVAEGRFAAVSWRCSHAALSGAEAAADLAGASPSVLVRGLWR